MDIDMTLPPTSAPRAPPSHPPTAAAACHNLWPSATSSSPSSVSSSGSSGASGGRGDFSAGGGMSLKRRWNDAGSQQPQQHQVSATTTPLPSFKRLRIASGPPPTLAPTFVPTAFEGGGGPSSGLAAMTNASLHTRNAPCPQDPAFSPPSSPPLSFPPQPESHHENTDDPTTNVNDVKNSTYQTFNHMLGALHKQRATRNADAATATSNFPHGTATTLGYLQQHEPAGHLAEETTRSPSRHHHHHHLQGQQQHHHHHHYHKKKSVVSLPSHSRLF